MYTKNSLVKYKKLLLGLALLIFGAVGCGNVSQSIPKSGTSEEIQDNQGTNEEIERESKEIAECYRGIYEQAVEAGMLGTLDTAKKIVECLGDAGYAAVDAENQVNMVNSEKVKAFIGDVEGNVDAELTIICVAAAGGFTRFDFQTSEEAVWVTRSYLLWNGKSPEINSKERYRAENWDYSQEGYLFFEKNHMSGYDGASGYTALRVDQLDERCRELNRQYLLPIGYGSNNMFITEWNEQDYEELDFYDMFHILYPLVYGMPTPYEVSYEGELYYVPQEEFERVVMSYFKIDSETLRSKTRYLEDSKVYEYRTRGFNDWGNSPNIPYPEVVQYEENADGTLTLTVNVVYPVEKISCAFSHEIVVRPLTDGRVQYVSNHVIRSADNIQPSWYTDRLTEEEREEFYGEPE
ncbi:DUF6070 family protein [Kineothrix sedimenti]|uniref:DUF6070 family protein n=1 Tax=Kineothrix sedimenti TaxID=3123317 RepID=A0ABZ3F272_9FIRM